MRATFAFAFIFIYFYTHGALYRQSHSPVERRHVEDTVAAIRLRMRHHDPYEEWEQQTRKDAFVR